MHKIKTFNGKILRLLSSLRFNIVNSIHITFKSPNAPDFIMILQFENS